MAYLCSLSLARDNLDVGALIDRLLKVFEGQGAAKSMVRRMVVVGL